MMRRIVFWIIFAISIWPSTSLGVANFEQTRFSDRVVYADGSYLKIECKNRTVGECSASVRLGEQQYDITQALRSTGKVVVPSQLALLSIAGDDLGYGLLFEIECDDYAESPPYFFCMAEVSMSGEKLLRFYDYKVYQRQEYTKDK